MKYSLLLIIFLTVINLAVFVYQLFKSTHKPKFLGSIILLENNSMYVEMNDDLALNRLRESDYVTFRVVKDKTQK